MKKTFQPSSKNIRRNWHLVDVKGDILGRISTRIAVLLMGKHKVIYSDHLDTGDYVVVINASEIKLTGNKAKQKTYKKHSGYPGGFKEVAYAKMAKEFPEKVIIHAVSGMLPDNRLKAKRLARLKVFKGENYPYKSKFGEDKKN
jgi:large subunit ribosomal protein L13